MATRGGFGATVGYNRLPGRVREGSQASFGKSYQQQSRAQMAGIIKQYESFINALEGVTPTAVEAMLRPTFEKALRYTPVKTGALKASGRMEVKSTASGARGEIKFGGGATLYYAPIVHESTWLAHKEPTRSKFLQAALEEDIGEFMDRGVAVYLDVVEGKKS